MSIALNRHSTFATGVACALVWAAAAQADTVDRRNPADPRGVVEISNVSGSLHVTGWDRSEVEVQGELDSDVERLDFTREGERTVIKVVLQRHSSEGDANLVIRVPQDSRLVISTVSADQIINTVRGAQRLQSVSGDIVTQSWNGELTVNSVDGDISVTGKSAKGQEPSMDARITTVSGDVVMTGLSGELDLNTVSGDMQVTAQLLTRAQIKSTNGDAHLSATLAREARVESEAINGDVTLDLDGTVNAEFDIESFNGEVDNCFGPKPKRSREHGPGTELRFKEGDGSARVRIKTLNGDISVCR